MVGVENKVSNGLVVQARCYSVPHFFISPFSDNCPSPIHLHYGAPGNGDIGGEQKIGDEEGQERWKNLGGNEEGQVGRQNLGEVGR